MRQTTALKILKSGANVFLTGQAGAGKTYTLNQYIKYLHAKDVPVAVTATTGIAATHIGGTTIHSWAGIGIKRKLTEKEFHILLNAEHVYERVCHARVLIIDEISMMHAHTLRLVDEVLRCLRKNPLPFGGVQVVFCGDFFSYRLWAVSQIMKNMPLCRKVGLMPLLWFAIFLNSTASKKVAMASP